MKLIKKIAAIMFAFMMVFSLGTNVKAKEGVNQNNGSLTINNAKANETYKIYRILDLDSYNYTDGKPKEGNYSYTYKQKGNNTTEWKKFVDDNAEENGSKFFDVTDGKYVTAKTTNGAEIAKAALALVTSNKSIQADDQQTPDVDKTITFENLPLGYYLVESSVGALCSLNTTNPSQTIEIKYTEPTVVKKIDVAENERVDIKTVNIGELVNYEVKITIGNGAKNYVFHDKIDTGLKYLEIIANMPHVDVTTNHVKNTVGGKNNYLNPDPNSEIELNYDDEKKNSFTLKFEDSFIQKLDEGDVITLTYHAMVTEDAPMDKAINNTAYLNYGNSQKTKEDYTSVFTYKVPVWKYTTKGNKVGLPGAKFQLYKNEACTVIVPLKQENTTNEYIYTPENLTYSLISDTDGNLVIKGLAAGEYYLKEIEAPNGYNKLIKPIKITLSHDNGNKQIKVEGTEGYVTQVDVENKTGSILPSTGGMGTTLIYLVANYIKFK